MPILLIFSPTKEALQGKKAYPGNSEAYGLRGTLSGLKGVQPPLPFGERTRDCSPGHAGKEGPQLALELRRPWGFSHEARRGSQGASRAAPGKSGLHARGEGERVLDLEAREG